MIVLIICMFLGIVGPLAAMGSEETESLLFSDPLDGTGQADWRKAPPAPKPAPDGKSACRYERDANWDPATQPWAGDESWTSYRVEVDILPEKYWAGVDFHVQDDGLSACNVTLLHVEDQLVFELSGLWGDAGAWKLWPVGQRQAAYEAGRWVKLRLDVDDRVLNLYIDDDPEPMASFYDLPLARGGIRLATFAGSAWFRNLRVTRLPEGSVKPILDDPWAGVRQRKVLRDWEITEPHSQGCCPEGASPGLTADAKAWKRTPVDERGVVNVTALFPDKNTSGVVFARTTITAGQAGTRRLKLTYTDNFSLWVNRLMIFEGPPRQWFHPDRAKHGHSRLIPDQYEVSVPVAAGENEIVVRSEATEPFGWGFWVRLVE
jgi:hypothetical protein